MKISDMILGVNIIHRKVTVMSINGAKGVRGCSEIPAGVLGGGPH